MKNKMNYKNQMNVLMDGIRKSYADWNGNPVDSKDEVRLNMIERFNSTIRIDNGRKFDKIVLVLLFGDLSLRTMECSKTCL